MDQSLAGLAFAAGMIAALNPCGFAMLPAYLALVVRGTGNSATAALGRAVAATAAMTLGFASGLPFNLSQGTLQAWLATAIVDLKTIGLFTLVVTLAALSWVVTAGSPGLTMPFWLAGMFGGLVIGLVIAFKKTVSVPLIVL